MPDGLRQRGEVALPRPRGLCVELLQRGNDAPRTEHDDHGDHESRY